MNMSVTTFNININSWPNTYQRIRLHAFILILKVVTDMFNQKGLMAKISFGGMRSHENYPIKIKKNTTWVI